MNQIRQLLAAGILSSGFLVGSCSAQAAPPVELPSVGYPVANLPAAAVAGRIQELLEASSLKADITIDRGTNRLMVRGSEEAQRVVRQAIGALDVPAASNRGPDASSLQPVALPPQQLERISNAMQVRYAQDKRIRFATDKRTGQLLILAPNNLQETLRNEALSFLPQQNAVQRTSGQESAQLVTLRFKLQRMSWQEVEDRLLKLSGDRPVVTTKRNGEVSSFQLTTLRGGDTQVEVDRRAGEIVITAPEPSSGGWKQTIQLLDQPLPPRSDDLELVRLEHAEPAPIQQALRLLSQLPTQNANPNQRLQTRGLPTAAVALQNINAPDAQPPANAGNPNQPGVVPVQPAPEAGAGVIGNVQVEFVPELGVLVVRGSKRDVQRVMEVIKQIEAESTVTQPEVAIQVLQHISAQAIADLLDDIYDDVFAPRQGAVTIRSLDSPNAVLLIGRKEAVIAVKALLEKLDQPTIPSAELKVFQLAHASAIDAETTIRDFFTSQPGSDDENRPGLGARVRIIADYRTNALIVQAAPRDLVQVAELIKNIDVDKIPSTQQIHVFKLRNSLAADLQTVLTTALTAAEDGDTGRSVPSARLSILSLDRNGNRIIDSGILTGVVITADANANALIVRAPSESMPLLNELITQLDQIPGGQSIVKVFGVQHGDASGLITMLTQLFALQQQQAAAAGGATGTAAGAVGQGIGATQLTAAPESSVLPLRLAVDRRTNSIIATGSKEDLAVVETLIARLDTEGLGSRITEVIWLRHATSTNVALALQDFVAGQTGAQIRNQNNPGIGQASGIIDLLDRDLIVADEPVTNSIIISVAPRLYDTVRRIIEQLDRRPPMVLIKAILCEVTLTDGFEFGSELGLQDSLLFDRSVSANGVQTPGFNFNNVALGNSNSAASVATRNQLGTQGLSSFLVGRTSNTFGYGGFVLSAASDSVNILIRALQDAGRIQILSRPQIMTLDNTLGYVLVGARVPRITGFTSNGLGNLQPTVTDTEVGLILRVRPRVGADGLILMDIDAQRSALGAEAEGVAIGFGVNGDVIRSPQILTTQAQSTISAYSNQTVIFGGLITKTRQQTSRRIPYISDIPLLGLLFRFDSEIERRTELLAVMTPMVISSDQDVEFVKATESSRMSYCLADVVEMHGPVGLSPGYGLWGPAVGATIYPDLQPTVDDLPRDACPEPVPMYQGESVMDGPIMDGPSGSGLIDPGMPQPTQMSPMQNAPSMQGAPAMQNQEVIGNPSAAWRFSNGTVQPVGYAEQAIPNNPPPTRVPQPLGSNKTMVEPKVGDVIRLPDFDIGPSQAPPLTGVPTSLPKVTSPAAPAR